MPRSDRPLDRKLIRLGFRVLGRARAHGQDVWPGLRIAGGRMAWRGTDLGALHPAADLLPHGAPLLAVVGSGPSLKDQHPERLPPGTALLCNGAASLVPRVTPAAVAVEDERFVFRHHAMLRALPRDVALLLSPAAIRAWAERDAASLAGRRVALIDNVEKPLGLPRRPLSDPDLRQVVLRGPRGAMSVAPDRGVVITGTVAFTALQFALAAAPERVLLAGIDLTNDAQPRFYEGADRAPSGLGAGLGRILDGFALARDQAERRGIALACASPVSALLGIGYGRCDALD